MEDVLNGPIKMNGRNTLTHNIGYTNKEALAWKKDTLNLMPGLMSATYRLSTRLGRWIGKMGFLLIHELLQLLKTLGKDRNFFKGLQSRRQFKMELAEVLGLTSDESKISFQEANTLSLTWSNKLLIQNDTNNCYREGCMFISSVSAVIKVDTLSDTVQKNSKYWDARGVTYMCQIWHI